MKNIPVLHVEGDTLAIAYEKALIKLYEEGTRFKTQYDKPGDPLSVDATMNITVNNPLADPMIHKCFPGSIYDLREYVYELNGHKDNWTKNINDLKDTRWEYLYSDRLFNYGHYKKLENGKSIHCSANSNGLYVNQIDEIINKLIKQPYTRQAQAILWIPFLDNDAYDAPCFQNLWCRMLEDDDGTYYLNYNIRFRSNDFYGANFMNMFGLTMLVKERIADKIMSITGRKVSLGRMNWQADSAHVYGKDIQQLKERLIDRIPSTSFEDRVYNFYNQEIQEMYHECESDLLKKMSDQEEKMKSEYK